jgi:conjugal transfer/entry exclusion protein
MRSEKRDITTEMGEIQKIIKSYNKSLYSTKLENLDAKGNFIDRYQVQKLNQNHINNLNSPINPKVRGGVINNLPNKQTNKA